MIKASTTRATQRPKGDCDGHKKRIIAYFRRSTEDQENSIERQRLAFKTYLKSNSEDYEQEPEVFIEDGVSGDSSVDRPIQNKLLENLVDGNLQADELFVSDSSRWGRFNTHHKSRFTLPLKEAGVMIRTPSTLINFNDPTSDLLYDVHQNLSYIENHERSHRVVAGTVAKVLSKTLALPECYGLKSEDGRLVEDAGPANVVRYIFRKFLETESRNKVVHLLNNIEKIPSPTGKNWTIQTVIAILKNPKYSGHYCYGRRTMGKIHQMDGSAIPKQRSEKEKGKVQQNEEFFSEYAPELVEPIIDLQTWAAAQLLLVRTSRPKGRARKKTYTGIFRCSCGVAMRGRLRNGNTVYSCQTGRASGCTGAEFHQSEIEDSINKLIEIALSEHALETFYNQHVQETSSVEENKAELVKLLTQYQTAQKRLADLDGLLPDGFIEKTRELKKKIDLLQNNVKENISEDNVRKQIQTIVRTIKQLDQDDSEELCPALLVKLGIIKEVTPTIVNHKSGKKTFSAASSHLIQYSLGNHSHQRIAAYPVSNVSMKFRVPKVLPRHFPNIHQLSQAIHSEKGENRV